VVWCSVVLLCTSSLFSSYSMPAKQKAKGVNRKARSAEENVREKSFTRATTRARTDDSEDVVFFVSPSVEDIIQAAMPHMVRAVLPSITEQVSSQLASQDRRGPSSQYQASLPGQIQDNRDFDEEPVEEVLQHHIPKITGDHCGDGDEDGAFSYNLTERELMKIQVQEFVDFAAMYKRQLRGPYASLPQDEPSAKCVTIEVIPITEWDQIFSAFLVEYVRAFPKDSLTLPKYLDLIMQMEANGME
jgi:hypothetical protein